MKTVQENTDKYKEGAIAGALVGIVIAAYLRKNIIMGGIIGIVGGGYIGYISSKSEIKTDKFKKQN